MSVLLSPHHGFPSARDSTAKQPTLQRNIQQEADHIERAAVHHVLGKIGNDLRRVRSEVLVDLAGTGGNEGGDDLRHVARFSIPHHVEERLRLLERLVVDEAEERLNDLFRLEQIHQRVLGQIAQTLGSLVRSLVAVKVVRILSLLLHDVDQLLRDFGLLQVRDQRVVQSVHFLNELLVAEDFAEGHILAIQKVVDRAMRSHSTQRITLHHPGTHRNPKLTCLVLQSVSTQAEIQFHILPLFTSQGFLIHSPCARTVVVDSHDPFSFLKETEQHIATEQNLVRHLTKLVELTFQVIEGIRIHANLSKLVPHEEDGADHHSSEDDSQRNDERIGTQQALVVELLAIRARVLGAAVAASRSGDLVVAAHAVHTADVVVDTRTAYSSCALSFPTGRASVDGAEGHSVVAAVVDRVDGDRVGEGVHGISAAELEGEGSLLPLAVGAAHAGGAAVVSLQQLEAHTHGGILSVVEGNGGVLRVGEIEGESVAGRVRRTVLLNQEDGRRLIGHHGLSVHDLVSGGLALLSALHIERNIERIAAEVVNDAKE